MQSPDPSYKQIIPYQLFARNGRVFVYQRGGNAGEKRLRGKLSAGIGGHINSYDSTSGKRLTIENFMQALIREREEETVCPPGLDARFLGWINDDSDDVGKVHLGSVFLCRLDEHHSFTLRTGTGSEDIHEAWLIFGGRYSQQR